jgi:hypothetical protein
MKFFNFLKTKKNRIPSLKSLRPPLFSVDFFWFGSLGIAITIFLIAAFVGFRFWYAQYFETYKQSQPTETYDSLINVDRLKSATQKRSNFLNQPLSLPKDPSL